MRIGFAGIGKLGLPCAVAVAAKGHDVMGYDINPCAMSKTAPAYLETGPDGVSPFAPELARSTIRFGSLAEVVEHAEILFVAVQTPHDPRYEGITRIPPERVDFDYTHLKEAMRQISALVSAPKIVVIISTVLPGTVAREIRPLLSPHIKLCYNPFFIAMGTCMRDFLEPEFVLLGQDDPGAARTVEAFYKTVVSAPVYRTTVENAELIKVAYNTFIGMKIVFANTLMEICAGTPGTDVDAVVGGLKMAHRRLISPAYMEGGMGDGGGCHPRDNIAMSWLARKLELSHDWFDSLMTARERQTEFLADLMGRFDLPKAILGYAYKPGTNLTYGSAALLLKNILVERGHKVLLRDPHVDGGGIDLRDLAPHVFLIGARHPELVAASYPAGSVVIDPWRCFQPEQRDVTWLPVGAPDRFRPAEG